jgi:hypothetical protein
MLVWLLRPNGGGLPMAPTRKKIKFVELAAFERITPLAAGYLCGYAALDPLIKSRCEFSIYDNPVTTDRDEILAALLADPAQVYGFSCYVWNIGVVRWLVEALVAHVPGVQIIIGGPQVMEHLEEYVPPGRTNVVVCNGEGEPSFRAYLRELLADEPDLSRVPGISFWRDGEPVTTPRPDRITDFDEIPSPYTSGVFEPGRYSYAILETNRGCPYHCGFCFWGAATNSKVHRFELQRVLDDITWISENGFMMLYIADANWGMLPRDVEITKHVVECRGRTGYPLMMGMNAAKNKPDRVSEITSLMVQGGMLTSQPVSLQSMDDGTLQLIERSNIRPETYTSLHRNLREQGISSFTEMIWPLPGETVASFRKGLTELCRSHADMILVYLQLLLHNTPIYENRERFGIQVRRVPDPAAEADVVVGTKWVNAAEYDEGVALYYAMQSLYSLRGLYFLANYLDRTGRMDFDELFTRAAIYFAGRAEDSPICAFIADSVRKLGNYYLLNSGRHTHMLLHGNRDEFTRLLTDFVAGQPFWADPEARALFELDLLARPYVYREKPSLPSHAFTELTVTPRGSGGAMEVEGPPIVTETLRELGVAPDLAAGPVLVRHPFRRKLPFRDDAPEANIAYCQGMTVHLRMMLPEFSAVAALMTR